MSKVTKKEILTIVESISNQNNMDKDLVFQAIESVLATIAVKRYQQEFQKDVDMRVSLDRKTGDYEVFRRWTIVDNGNFEFPDKQLLLEDAKKKDSSLEVGDIWEEQEVFEGEDSDGDFGKSLEFRFGRIAAQQAKQLIIRAIAQAKSKQILQQYSEQIGTLLSGVVKKVLRDQIVLDISNGLEAAILKEEMIPKETVQIGDRVRGILYAVKDDRRGPMLYLSRIRPEMLIELFKIEVPEVNEDIIEIKGAARDPGSRAKLAVKTNDGRIDPIGACIGMRGSRVQAVSNELAGERIDIVLWDGDPAQLVVNVMAPAEIASIVLDEAHKSMDVVVKEEQLALAIGRGGQNVRLASELTGWKLNITTVAEAEKKTKEEGKNLIQMFVEKLDVDEELAGILVHEGFRTLEDVAYAPIEDMQNIEGFDKEIAEALSSRARTVLLELTLTSKEDLGKAEPAKDLLEMEGMTRHLAYVLANHGIITREDLAEQSIDELSDIKELDEETAAKLIMIARKPWFENEQE
jgi:transcription termination/antitermination protein NusA